MAYQLGETLKQRLESGVWEPHAQLPTGRELQEHFGVSGMVVREALDMLEDDGEVYRIRGKGTYVTPPKALIPICGLLRALFDPPSPELTVSIISVACKQRDSGIAECLGLDDPRTELCQVGAILSVGEPVCVVDSYLPVGLLPWLPETARRLMDGGRIDARRKLRLGGASGLIEGSRVSPFTSSKLDGVVGRTAIVARLLQVGAPSGSRRPRPIEFARLVYRADRAKLLFELG
jgi:GntR family transcriptional regulator